MIDHPTSYSKGTRVIPAVLKRQECEASFPLLRSSEVKNAGSCTSALPYTSLCGSCGSVGKAVPFLSLAVFKTCHYTCQMHEIINM